MGFFFLLAVLVTGFYGTFGPVLFSAALSALAWNLFFIPPRFTLAISNPEDIALCAGYFVTALVTGILTNRARELEALATEREVRTLFLYEVVKDILELSKPGEFLQRIALRVEDLTGGKCTIALGEGPAAGGIEFEIKGRHSTFGRLIFSNGDNAPSNDQKILLNSVAQQIGLSLERLSLEEKIREARRLKESEHLHQTLLNSVSHELRTPLTTLMGFASSLKEPTTDTPEFRKALSEGLSEASGRMNRVVGNLLDMSRLNSGTLSLKKEWHDISDLIGVVLNGTKAELGRHRVNVETPALLPLIQMDFQLMEHALSNLVVNAAAYSPPESQISIVAGVRGDRLELTVSDHGPGIPEPSLTKIFEKFYRAPGTPPGGTGLGLSIVKSIVDLHSGKAEVRNLKDGGSAFSISLPLGNPPPNPGEEIHD